jgi:hypothetical protein
MMGKFINYVVLPMASTSHVESRLQAILSKQGKRAILIKKAANPWPKFQD